MINLSEYSKIPFFPKNKNLILFIMNPGAINFVKEIKKKNHIEKIYYKTATLENFFNKDANLKNIKKLKLNDPFLFSLIILFIIFIKIKFQNKTIIFFHESSWLEFDILINLFNLKGIHYLTSAVESGQAYKKILNFFKVKDISLLKKIFYSVLKILFKRFNFYYRKKILKESNLSIFIFCQKYNDNVLKKFFLIQKKNNTQIVKKILFLPSVGENNVLKKKIFEKIILVLSKSGYKCYIKEHPSITSRLNISTDNGIVMNHYVPIEVCKINFDWVVGSTSCALFNFTNSISIIKLYMKNKKDYIAAQNFSITSGSKQVLFPKNINQIIKLITKK
jgi:hypothetical protein